MTEKKDRELLELAAKAAGLAVYFKGEVACGRWKPSAGVQRIFWNPLVDDGDALRLAVKLRMCVKQDPDASLITHIDGMPLLEPVGETCLPCDEPHRAAATRRAIVRAAAAIGEQMP